MDIREILDYQIAALEELDSILDSEKEVLIKDLASELPGIVDKKKLIAQKLSLLENKRLTLTMGKNAEELEASGLIAREQVDRLLKVVGIIKEKEETNYILTKQSLSYIRLITSALNPGQRVVTYGSSGRAQDNSPTGLFTTKA